MQKLTMLEKAILDISCDKYADVDMPINACIEKYLIDDCGLNSDDSYEISLELSEKSYNIMC